MEKKPILITLTGQTCSGKSYLFNYIRDVAKLPCLISTKTRDPRAGEKEGVDYYFISEATSKQLEEDNQFAELATYRGIRYGVTKKEYLSKLSQGLAFLIVEPSGIDHYVQPAIDAGARHIKYYVYTDPAERLSRFKLRVGADIGEALSKRTNGNLLEETMKSDEVRAKINSSFDRFHSMLTEEKHWGTMHHWDRTLFGTSTPEYNLSIIMRDVEKAQAHDRELASFRNMYAL